MNTKKQAHADKLYRLHLRTFKLQGMSNNTIDSYARAVRRFSKYFDYSPNHLTTEQLEAYFAELVVSHSWSTVKIDRNGLQFFWKYVLKTDWQKGHGVIYDSPRTRRSAPLKCVLYNVCGLYVHILLC